MTEYSRLAKGSFKSTGAAKVINLPFQPDRIEIINYTAAAAMTDDVVPFGWWNSAMGQGFAVIERSTGAALISDIITSNGFSTFSAGQLLQYGASVVHGGSPVSEFTISKASPAVVTTTGNHGLASGDVIVFQNLAQTSTTGMQQIAGIPFTVTVTAPTTFTIPWDTSGSNYTVFDTSSSTGNVGSYKKVLYPYLYFPGASVISAITLGATTTIDTTDAHNFVVGQEVAFRIPKVWGTVGLNSLPNSVIPGSPIYGYVVAVTDYNTVVVNINSTLFDAFVPNQPFASYRGEQFPQIVAVGDVNTGGVQISSGSPLYPSPYSVPIGTTQVSTINGPAILGSYVNNTAQGFVVGAGSAVGDADAHLVGAAEDVIYWAAYLDDITMP